MLNVTKFCSYRTANSIKGYTMQEIRKQQRTEGVAHIKKKLNRLVVSFTAPSQKERQSAATTRSSTSRGEAKHSSTAGPIFDVINFHIPQTQPILARESLSAPQGATVYPQVLFSVLLCKRDFNIKNICVVNLCCVLYVECMAMC